MGAHTYDTPGGPSSVRSAPRAVPKMRDAFCMGCKTFVPVRTGATHIGEHRLFWFDGRPSKLCDGIGQKIPPNDVDGRASGVVRHLQAGPGETHG